MGRTQEEKAALIKYGQEFEDYAETHEHHENTMTDTKAPRKQKKGREKGL